MKTQTSLTKKASVTITLLASLVFTTYANAALVSYDTAGNSYTQNFDTLPVDNTPSPDTWSDGTTVEGWHWADDNGATRTVIYASSGAAQGSGQDNVLSIGIAGVNAVTDRALGAQSPNSGLPSQFIRYGVGLTNDTGSTLNSFSIGFTAEQWRAISGEGADQLTFDYQVFSGTGSLTAASGWTGVGSLTFDAPQTVGSSTTFDGNASANRQVFSPVTVSGVDWQDGEELWLRWNDAADISGDKRAIMGIDDVSFSAVIPEPGSLLMLVTGFATLLFIRKRK